MLLQAAISLLLVGLINSPKNMTTSNTVINFEKSTLDAPPSYTTSIRDDPNNDVMKIFQERVNILKENFPEIPIDLIQSSLELDDLNSINSVLTHRNKYILKYLDPDIDKQQYFMHPYQTLKNKMKKDSNIDDLISQMKSYCVSEINKFLNDTNTSDLWGDYKKAVCAKKKFEKDYKKMLKTAKFINWGNHIIVDPSANDRLTYFSTKDLIDLVENYFIPSCNYTRSFKLPKGTIDRI